MAQIRIAMRTAVLAAACISFMWTGCSDKEQSNASFNIFCEANGICECTSNVDCGHGQICYNGWCRAGTDEGDVAILADGRGLDISVDAVIQPGTFKAPCETDLDCNSGVCLEITSGVNVCSEECIDDCPEDWECRGISQEGSQVSFLCFPPLDRLCQPCMTDVSCTGGANLCLDIGGVLNCGRDCSNLSCPNGYQCVTATSIEGATALQCVPTNGHCQCTPENSGKAFACEIENEFGACQGQQLCQEDGSMTTCDADDPEAEVCDDTDNDCDGFVDEQGDLGLCTVQNEFGECEGQRVCLPAQGESCTAPLPAPESCDSLDNDCDGEVDEDFKSDDGLFGLLEHCGGCGISCVGKFAHAEEIACNTEESPAACELVSCIPGFVLAQGSLCLPPIHHLCEPCTGDAACVGANDRCLQMNPADTQTFCGRDCGPDNEYEVDCPTGYLCTEMEVDGESTSQCTPVNSTCDCSELSAGQVKPCQSANEFGLCYGVATCDPNVGWTGCTAKTPEEEVCDGFDNDCDGVVDDGLTGGPCTAENEHGTCEGKTVCLGIDGSICTATEPALEICDGKDNDCDGTIDQPFATTLFDDEGNVLGSVYDLSAENCGGCGIPCYPTGAATATACASLDGTAFCQVTSCQPGYYIYQGQACLPIPQANLCLPCGGNADCIGPGDKCLSYDNGGFCGRDCGAGSSYSVGEDGDPGFCTGEEGVQGCCPSGYLCHDDQCRRASNDCSCDATGKIRPCAISNGEGTCHGTESCVAEGDGAGWQPCSAISPAPEMCDGIDNDCDGLVDALDDSIDTSTAAGYPDCFNVSDACSGDWVCAAIGGQFQWTCTAQQAAVEVCNDLDDDCDGTIDEDFTDGGEFTLIEHCGRCGLDCRAALAHLLTDDDGDVSPGAVTCEVVLGEPACVPQLCESGFYPFPATGTPSVCLAVQAANCQPCVTASDCPGIGHACGNVGDDDGEYCLSRCDSDSPFPDCTGVEGAQGCCPDGYLCTDAQGFPPGELHCRPISATCKCSAENAGLNRPCTVDGDGQTCFGVSTCDEAPDGLYTWTECDTSANVEVCDGQDNDCDGVVDDGFLSNGEYASDANCGSCGKNCLVKWSLSKQHAYGACDAQLPGGPDCVIGACAGRSVGGGTPCHEDADCTGNAAGSTCLEEFLQCGTICTGNGDCPGGQCVEGACAPQCANDAACAQFGAHSTCENGGCVTAYDYVDLDSWTGNGCECPATVGLDLDRPDTFATYPLPGASYADRNCDGIDGDLDSALFVVAGQQGGDGSLGSPFGAIQAAIDAYDSDLHSHILVSVGVYAEQLVLSNGVRIHGGYSPDFTDRDIVLFPTVVQGPTPNFSQPEWLPGALYAKNITQRTVVAGLTIVGYDVPATGAGIGEDSVTVFVDGASPELHLLNNYIIPGKGGPGADGAPGPAGKDGGAGGAGLHSAECTNGVTCNGNGCNEKSCANHSQPGGSGGTPAPGCQGAACALTGCDGMESDGAESPQTASGPAQGCSYPVGGYGATYAGGPSNHCKYDCFVSFSMVGLGGSDGLGGDGGGGGAGSSGGLGSIVNGIWTAPAAASGSSGTGGAGGGGGSSGAYITNTKASNCTIGNPRGDLGGSGGGGGSGGNGGFGGGAGGNGGASIGVLLTKRIAGSHATVAANVVGRGIGGKGGRGGNGGSSGKGGPGGFGGDAGWPAWCAGVGGPGGRGGDGGPGGGGGGGSGGISVAIAAVEGSNSDFALNQFTLADNIATGGSGGDGGQALSPASPGGSGATAQSTNIQVY
jgi:hypothetical protein